MLFTETKLRGAWILDLERREDERGFFARAFCQREFEAHGLKPVIAQANVAFNKHKGTLRGMHFQFPPAPETKLVRSWDYIAKGETPMHGTWERYQTFNGLKLAMEHNFGGKMIRFADVEVHTDE